MRSYVLSIWSLLDPLYYSFTRLTYLNGEDNIFRIRLTRYKGKKMILSDGAEINKNDIMVKIHLHNVRLLNELKDIKSDLRKARRIYSHVQKSLPGVEAYIRNHRRSDQIKGIIGITMLNKGCERLGFEVCDIAHPVYKCYKWITLLPIWILSSHRSGHVFKQAPTYLFMSAETLSKLYKE
ncbi:hypothetical protein J7E71_06420 [Mesobacillus foraminis]|uniref:YkoP family protein n=1 Tax=Mesobacillus foraminis TaxID=279826 RepID=UPI001BEB0C3E|nr:hypothetical protein [Mesobacillus foraminis]MBT2755594.1 hypothetical protein [Mesobacillus foraminis]